MISANLQSAYRPLWVKRRQNKVLLILPSLLVLQVYIAIASNDPSVTSIKEFQALFFR